MNTCRAPRIDARAGSSVFSSKRPHSRAFLFGAGLSVDAGPYWRPTASLEMLRARAGLYQQIRAFFQARNVLEVDVPLLGRGTVPDPAIDSVALRLQADPDRPRYLQTSPELFHKRLLAAGSGPIWQLAHVVRDEPTGRYHNPEFVLLEWYRPGFILEALMLELAELLQAVGLNRPVTRVSYVEAFARWVGIPDVLNAETGQLREAVHAHGIELASDLGEDPLSWLQLLQVQVLEPALRDQGAVFIEEWPATQAALARLHPEKPGLALRFELYVDGIELANGYDELADPQEQRTRFAQEQALRRAEGREVWLDEAFLAALDAGLPACSGVALGVDRLLMLLTGAQQIREVMAFAEEGR